MFTVKFLSFFNDSSAQTSISCPHYEAYSRSNGTYSIVCYKDMACEGGVERQIAPDSLHVPPPKGGGPSYFHACYVENQAGKTIDKFVCQQNAN